MEERFFFSYPPIALPSPDLPYRLSKHECVDKGSLVAAGVVQMWKNAQEY